ncbi:hypothetical protein AeMF1_006818 [Aphanomyces euteiches]|nr:hypothetical protein AeMF1_006818 [Aphanomyces euteiches]KAH9178467.1 hypothetical protein AeNC1_017439 [Aphanomyces euteiches]
MNTARQPCAIFAVMGITEAWASCQRITKLLVCDKVAQLETTDHDEPTHDQPVITITDGDFSWGAANTSTPCL